LITLHCVFNFNDVSFLVSGRAAKLNLLATTVDAFHRSGFAILTMTVWTEATKKIVSGILRFLR